MKFAGIIFDFDGVLIDSEYVGNRQIADYLSRAGHPTTVEQSMAQFMGLADQDFHAAVEKWIGRSLPDDFHTARAAEDARVMAEGIDPVAGAIGFVQSLPAHLPRAIASSSSTRWISRHLEYIGLRDDFGAMIFSGREHVSRGKPAPDLYLHAASALGVAIEHCVILEDSPVGATAAVASGAHVIGLCAGMHCARDHERVLRQIGVHDIAHDFGEVARIITGPVLPL
ncbi:MAG: HAD family phosphatase [Sphingomonas sp.]|uniref:HAD family hydrolase n=1 Tax=Sphingomonas sp. TaxID=28214 RepID=UPI0035A8DF3F|nr:HAD family phosphatase [Sphingomonas sp.]